MARTVRTKKQMNINKWTAKVVSAIIQKGWYEFNLSRQEDYCEIDIREIILSRYCFVRVYPDGICTCHGLDRSRTEYEMSAKYIKSIQFTLFEKQLLTG